MSKKTLLIILFILIVVGLGCLVYFVFFKPAPAPPPVEVPPVEVPPARLPVKYEAWERMTFEERERIGLPGEIWPEGVEEILPRIVPEIIPEIDTVAQGRKTWVNPVSFEPVFGPTLSSDGKSSVYWNKTDGYFYQVSPDGIKTKFSEQKFFGLDKINWAPNKDKAILEYPDGFKVLYDFNQNRQYTLPRNWQDFSFDQSGQQIAFKSTSQYPEDNWLAVASPDGTYARPIEPMGENADKVVVSWSPNNQVVAFSSTGNPRGTWEEEMLLIGQNQENFKALIVEGKRFEHVWSPEGERIAYSVYNDKNNFRPRLYLVEAQGDRIGANKIDTGVSTWAHKCSYSKDGESLYCAVPKNLPEGSGLVPELAKDIQDDFYQIDVKTGKALFLAEGAVGGYNVSQLYLSEDESILYFVDSATGTLKSIRLK